MLNNEIEVSRKAKLLRLKALASPVRLTVLEYLKDPVANFPPQVDGDFAADGVCADFLRAKLGIAAATASRHLTLLADAGLVIATRKKGWTFYRRNEDALARFAAELVHDL
jgi:DNA-binding transcriptional ArsR family regulator